MNPLTNRAFRITGWIVLGLVCFIALVMVAAYAFSETMRDYAVNKANSHLKTYEIRMGKIRLHPLWFTAEVWDFSIIQKANPDPPILLIPHLTSGIYWPQILHGRIVGDTEIERLKLHVDPQNIQEEAKNNYPIKRESWQQAIESIYPLKLDRLVIRDGELTYVEKGRSKPLQITQLNIAAHNIQNISSPDHVYPSSFRMDGVIFGSGTISVDGNGNFLAEPHITLKAAFDLGKMNMDYFKPMAERYNLALTAGVLSTSGDVEYGIEQQSYVVNKLTIDGLRINYSYDVRSSGAGKKTAKKAAKTAGEMSDNATVTMRIDHLQIKDGVFGYINKSTDPSYRIFISDAYMDLDNFSNQSEKGPATLKLTGNFMDSGATEVQGDFRTRSDGPDFDLSIAIEDTQMTSMSDIFRAYGNFDIKAGLFSCYSEMKVKDKQISGYVKPMFKNMEVTDMRPEQEKNAFRNFYVGAVNIIIEALENSENKVVTKADISGTLEDPDASVPQIIGNLLQNAFFKSILAGLAESIPAAQK